MDLVSIGLRSNGERYINYNYLDLNIPEDTEIFTITKLEPTILEKIKTATLKELQKILSDYV